jgi:hypothetical protein
MYLRKLHAVIFDRGGITRILIQIMKDVKWRIRGWEARFTFCSPIGYAA